jgi:hypothetical protein
LKFRALGLVVLLVARGAAAAGSAEPFDAATVPDALRPWIEWVLAEDTGHACPLLTGTGERRCAWSGPLALDVDAEDTRFTQSFEVASSGAWVTLPGDAVLWPEGARADGQPLAVIPDANSGSPTAWLARGRHQVDGRLRFRASRPALLPIPSDTALVALRLDGVEIAAPARDESGRLWLEAPASEAAPEDFLEVLVQRRVVDSLPLQIETRLLLRVAGRAREVALGPVDPEGFVPLALEGDLPARLESDGRLRVQLRPGEHVITIRARHEGPVAALAPPTPGDAPLAAEEVWVFDARPDLRIVAIEGVAAIDPNQTELPGEWRQLPAYLLRRGDTMRLDERRRGDPDPADHLSLDRTLWLDFDGAGFSFRDAMSGRLRRNSRLEMPEPSQLGRAVVGGRDWFLTRLGDGGATGVEVSPGDVTLQAEGRIENADASALPAVGWSNDFDQLSGRLMLPPGWSLVHAFGVDHASPTWVTSWTLLDFFLVLIAAAAAARLWGRAWGALALATFVLTWVEPAAPRWVWLGALAAEALVLVLRGGRAAVVARGLRGVAWLLLALQVVPYAVGELQRGLHPALARPYAPGIGLLGRIAPAEPLAMQEEKRAQLAESDAGSADSLRMEDEAVMPAAPAAERPVRRYIDMNRLVRGSGPRDLRSLDPDARIPTGPGVPTWQWLQVDLSWSGPVEAQQTLRLWLISPFLARVLSFARVLLLAALCFAALRRAAPNDGAPALARFAVSTALLLSLLSIAAPIARAELPSPELLRELHERLSKPPACTPNCASIARLAVEVRDNRLRLRVEAHAAVATAIPLPAATEGSASFMPQQILVDARSTEALRRESDGALWVALDPGVHEVLLEGRIGETAARIEIPFPMRARAIEIDAPGWQVEGIDAQGGVSGALSLVRVATPGAAPAPSLRPAPPPFFAQVERRLSFDVAWSIATRVVRLSAAGQAAVLEVPLLDGEAVATEGIAVEAGNARLAFAPDATEISWSSTLEPRASLVLRAPASVAWVEDWQLAVSPIWHVEAQGIPPVALPEDDPAPLRAWRPWPGESLTLTAVRPLGVGGATLTIDRADLALAPGLRSRDARLDLTLRSTQGGRHTVTLPEGAEVRAVRIDGIEQPLRAEGREVSLPIRPGEQTVQLEWRSPDAISWRIATPEVALGAPAVNLGVQVAVPENRWVLAVSGPRLGPAVLFWSVLFVLALVSLGLAQLRGVPLRFHQWFLLGLGLTQVPVWMSAVVVAWFFALSWRRDRATRLGALSFDAAQIALALATAVAVAVLFEAIRHGLLGTPDMQIAGNGSTAYDLRWYQDRSDGRLPAASLLSVPLGVYRLAMLFWALWLARALLRWLRWGWDCFAHEGVWRVARSRSIPTPTAPS